jgi:hypothetical protein
MQRRAFIRFLSGVSVLLPWSGPGRSASGRPLKIEAKCDFPHPMSKEEFFEHHRNFVAVEKFEQLEERMMASGRLVSRQLEIEPGAAIWTYVFRDHWAYLEWELSHIANSLVKYDYAGGSFRFSQKREYI